MLSVSCGATFQQLNHSADFCETSYKHSTIGRHSTALIFLLPTTSDNNVMNMQTCNSGASTQHILFTYFLTPRSSLSSPGTLWNPKVHYCIYKSPLPLPILSQINPIYALLPTPWRSIFVLSSHLCLCLPSGLFPSGFPIKTLYTPLLSSECATYPANFILLDSIIQIIYGEEYRLLRGQTIKFANSPPCACHDSTGQKP